LGFAVYFLSDLQFANLPREIMMKNSIFFLLIAIFALSFWSICFAEEELQIQIRGHEAILTHQVIDDGRLLVSAKDTANKPIRGLTLEDFVVQRGIKKARILSAEPLETTQEIPLNIVLVIDNSFSMAERQAVEPLLAALDEFLKTVRPIDNIHLVVFSSRPSTRVKKYALHARIFHSSARSQLKDFLNYAFEDGQTGRTYLHEAMVAGLDIIRKMPAKDQKFMVVFSDGEDLNSDFDENVVASEAEGISNFEVFCVDYMPGAKTNRFLKAFAEDNRGRIWKATTATELMPIFQAFSTTLLYRYVISYRILDPPGGTLTIEPGALTYDMLTMLDGSPVGYSIFFEPGKSEIPATYTLFTDEAQTRPFEINDLTHALERYQHILNLTGSNLRSHPEERIRIVGSASDSGIEKGNHELSRNRAAAVKKYLHDIWGIDKDRMAVEARNLPLHPAPVNIIGGRAENRRVEIVFESAQMQARAANEFVLENQNVQTVKITPQIVAGYDIASWELTIMANEAPVKKLSGQQGLEPVFSISPQELGIEKLAAAGNLQARIKVTDIYNDSHETVTEKCPVQINKKILIHELVRPPAGSVAIKPQSLTIEELTTIDSSPLLNFVFFETGESEIPARYINFANQATTNNFDESQLKDSMEKYYHTLNIIGKRLRETPEARIRIVGCNSNRAEEQGKTDLSRSRAESVRAYLKYIWGIESSRMTVEARNLPAVASSGSVSEGRQENQRVEIYSETSHILDTIKSTYVEEICDTREVQIVPKIQAGYDLARWRVELTGDGTTLQSLDGQGDLDPLYRFDLEKIGFDKIGKCENIGAKIEVVDKKGQSHQAYAGAAVKFIRREERLAQKKEYRVMEKYALILFDFNRADIKDHNKVVMDRILARIKEIPSAKVTIVGHTDSIGKEMYNIDLSMRRAKAAYEEILAGGIPEGENIKYAGAGPHDPLFDNNLPEGRALNRTVTVTLEYEQKE
jgi:outer membrane protein OmpA-like peptidoglycan-associated protein/Mg-chelatase subunit ChlD